MVGVNHYIAYDPIKFSKEKYVQVKAFDAWRKNKWNLRAKKICEEKRIICRYEGR